MLFDFGNNSAFPAIDTFAKLIDEASVLATAMLNPTFVIGYGLYHLLQCQTTLSSTLESMRGVIEDRRLLQTSEL